MRNSQPNLLNKKFEMEECFSLFVWSFKKFFLPFYASLLLPVQEVPTHSAQEITYLWKVRLGTIEIRLESACPQKCSYI